MRKNIAVLTLLFFAAITFRPGLYSLAYHFEVKDAAGSFARHSPDAKISGKQRSLPRRAMFPQPRPLDLATPVEIRRDVEFGRFVQSNLTPIPARIYDFSLSLRAPPLQS